MVVNLSMSLRKLLDRLDKTELAAIKPVPKGWWTMEQFRAETGLSEQAGSRRMARLLAHKLVKRRPWKSIQRRRQWIYKET